MKALFVLLAFFSHLLVFAQTESVYPDPTFASPRETMNYFLKTMKGYKLGDQKALDLAVQTLDLSELDTTSRVESGRLVAKRLVNTLDRIEYIDISKIPENPTGAIWVYQKKIVHLDGDPHPVEISIGLNDETKKWLFTKQTVKTIHHFEQSLKDKSVAKGVTQLTDWKTRIKEKMPEWTGKRNFILLNGQWLGIFFLILFGLVLNKITKFYFAGLAVKILLSKSVEFDKEAQKKLTRPMGVLVFSATWILGIRVLELSDSILSILLRFGYIIFTIGCVVTAHHLVDVVAMYFQEIARKSKNKFDDILVPLIRKTAKTFVMAIGVVAIGDSLTLDMKSILAGLGIGGIAFALASKDTISNLFGSLTVLLDRPFRIGDWILIGSDIEGTVEEVGLRSTRIRTFYDSLITVPNGQLTNIHIDNYGKRTYRRFSTTLGLQYDTPPEKIEAFCEAVRQIILAHKWTRKDYFHVYFNGMGVHSLDIMVYVFWSVPDWSKELAEKHRFLLDVLRAGNEIGVHFAFPTQTLHLYNERPYSYEEMDPEKAHEVAKDTANKIISRQVTKSEHRSGINSGISKEDQFSL